MVSEIHKGDINTKFLITVKRSSTVEDISGVSTKQIKFQKPDGTDVTKTAIFETDGTDGKIYYLTVADDLDEVGTWTIQAYLVMAAGTWNSSKGTFVVHDNLS